MKKLYFLGIVSIVICLAGCSGGSEKVSLKNDYDSASYALGVNTGASYKDVGDVDVDLVIAGFVNALKGKETNMTAEFTYDYLNRYFNSKLYGDNVSLGEVFLSENATKEGVKVTNSGLQYRVVQEGTGAKPTINDTVEVKYLGRLIDGTAFDSSDDDVVKFAVKDVIPGWTEAVQLMNVGSKYEIWLPYNLAYGETGVAGFIEPFSTLCFEVELVNVIKGK